MEGPGSSKTNHTRNILIEDALFSKVEIREIFKAELALLLIDANPTCHIITLKV